MYESNNHYFIEIVQDLEGFRKLKQEWNELAECQSHSPWLCWNWFDLWLKYFLEPNKPFILVVYKADKIVAIAPFVTRDEKFRGMINTKKIELIGNFHSHVRNVVFSNSNKEERSEILSSVFEFLRNQYTDWDLIELDSIPEENLTYTVLKSIIPAHDFMSREYFCFGDWYLDGINYSSEEYMKRLSKNTRSGTGKKKRRMEKLGKLEFQVSTDVGKLDYHLNLYEQVRAKSWKHPEMDRKFLKESRRMAAEKECLKFGLLSFDGAPIAVFFAIISKRIAYLMEVVYDLEFDRFSPGEVLHAEFIKNLIDVDGVTEIDALRGDEPYKKSWTPQRRERKGILIFNNNFKGQLLGFLMTKFLPMIEKNRSALIIKDRISEFVKKYRKSRR